MAKNKPTEQKIPGQGQPMSQASTEKMQEITEKVNALSGKVGTGVIAATMIADGIGACRTALNDGVDGPLYDAIQDLKRQAKSAAISRIKEEIPTKQEIIDKLKGYSCDINVMRIVKQTKETLEAILNGGKSTLESIVAKLERIQKSMEKAAEYITIVTVVLAVFKALVMALELLITAAALALNFFSSLFAAAGPEKLINDAIDKAKGFVLKYTGMVKTYTNHLLKVLTKIMIIFNFIPKIISFLKTIITMIIMLLELILKYFSEYIEGCNVPDITQTDEDGNVTGINDANLDDFINADLSNTGNGLGGVDKYGEYIHDDSEKQHKIYKPKIN